MNQFYNMYNLDFISQQAKLYELQYHTSQSLNVADSARKLEDFLESTDKVSPEYQEALISSCCAVLFSFAKSHGII